MRKQSFLSRLSPSGLFPNGESLVPKPKVTELEPPKKSKVKTNTKRSSGITNKKFVHKIPKYK